MSTKINDDSMSLKIDGCVIATAQFSEHAAADGHGAWTVSRHPGRLFARNQAITAMVLAERLAFGCGEDDPFVVGWREELGARTPGSPARGLRRMRVARLGSRVRRATSALAAW